MAPDFLNTKDTRDTKEILYTFVYFVTFLFKVLVLWQFCDGFDLDQEGGVH